MLLWYGKGDDDAISLGSTPMALQAFAEIGSIVAEDEEDDYAELLSVPQFAEQDVDAEWLKKAQAQAQEFAASYKADLSEDALWVLGELAKPLASS